MDLTRLLDALIDTITTQIVCRLRPKKPAEAFQRLRTLPGEQAQVDWARPVNVVRGKQL